MTQWLRHGLSHTVFCLECGFVAPDDHACVSLRTKIAQSFLRFTPLSWSRAAERNAQQDVHGDKYSRKINVDLLVHRCG